MENTTRQLLIETGAAAMLDKGYHAAGLNQILSAAGVPKGSFYYYFKSKEDLGVAIINHFAETSAARMEQYLGDRAMSPLARLRAFFTVSRIYYEADNCRHGCLICKLGTELAAASDDMREALRRAIHTRLKLIAGCIHDGQAAGEITTACDPETLAIFLYNAWSGAIVQMQIEQNPGPLQKCIDFIFTRLLSDCEAVEKKQI